MSEKLHSEILRFQHTAARRRLVQPQQFILAHTAVSTHSRPKAAGSGVTVPSLYFGVSTHSRPKAAGTGLGKKPLLAFEFQHTAARRRLVLLPVLDLSVNPCFNTQPPEGGWKVSFFYTNAKGVSTHSRPKAAGDFG